MTTTENYVGLVAEAAFAFGKVFKILLWLTESFPLLMSTVPGVAYDISSVPFGGAKQTCLMRHTRLN